MSGKTVNAASQTSKYIKQLKWVIPATTASVIIPAVTGYPGNANTLLTFTLLLLARKNLLTLILACLVLLAISLYIPVGYSFGKIDYSYVASVFQTNQLECLEFARGVSVTAWFLLFFAVCSVGLFFKYGKDFNTQYRAVYFIAFILININSWPKRFIFSTITYVQQVSAELDKLTQSLMTPDDFHTISGKIRYKNVVVVIGESVTRDYLSVYGYKHNTTPWLNTVPGTFFTDYISAAPNTWLSLPRTLALTDGVNAQENNSIVALANKAGFNTFWLSNQGFLSDTDTPATIISSRANHRSFFKKGDYNSNHSDDMALLSPLRSIVSEHSDTPNAIFLHMIGSHPDSCSRLNGFPINFRVSPHESVNCYLATVQKLDAFLQEAHQILVQKGEPFALFYFSDHGMTIDNSDRPVRHGSDARQNYHVPLFILTSNDHQHLTDDTPISASQFIALFSWITGISSDLIPAHAPEQLSDKQRTVFNGQQRVPYLALHENDIVQ